MELNNTQKIIIESEEKNILVIAGPGTGKTTCLISRINYLLLKGIKEQDIVAITFTNFAAQEIKERLPFITNNLFVGTIHSYANKFLLEKGIDTSEHIDNEDFDWLLIQAMKISNKKIKYLLVDEFQDLCDLEYEFIKSIEIENSFFIGDDDQAIYSFKGANVGIFFNLINDNNYKKYLLIENYRCGRNIIQFASEYLLKLSKRYSKQNYSKISYAGRVEFDNYVSAISNIFIKQDYKDWFILTRTNKELETVANYLNIEDIPYITFKKGDYSFEEIQKFLTSNVVKLLTIHSAKGLESDNVIVIGANQWNDDENRLCYVAATRARKNLYWCKKINTNKNTYGKKMKMLDWA